MGPCALIPQIWGAIWVELVCARKFVKGSTHIRVNFYSGVCELVIPIFTDWAVFADFFNLPPEADAGKVSVSS